MMVLNSILITIPKIIPTVPNFNSKLTILESCHKNLWRILSNREINNILNIVVHNVWTLFYAPLIILNDIANEYIADNKVLENG